MQKLGRYEIIKELGRGAMGAVFLAHDPVIERTVAIKTILSSALSPSEEQGYRDRFFREAKAAGRLSHPGIVTIHDVGEDEGTKTPYIVMEFIPGRTLEAVASETPGPLPAAITLDLGRQIAEALQYAHAEGIVHRDIKPANIIVTVEGRPKITDFGIARLRQAQLTVPGEVLGTPSFMSPEQVEGNRTDGRSDLFSLGVILYCLLTGQKPFAGEDLPEVMFKIAYKDAPLPTDVNPSLAPEFNYVLTRALAKVPELRYQSGRELAQDLEDLRRGRPPRSRSAAGAAAAAAPDKTIVAKSSEVAKAIRIDERTIRIEPAEGAPPAPSAAPVAAGDWAQVAAHAKVAGQKALALTAFLLRQLLALTAFLLTKAIEFGQTLPERSRAAVALGRRTWQWSRSLPRTAQVLSVVLLVAVGALSLVIAFSPKATLRISLSHDFSEGTVSVWVDDKLVAEGDLKGGEAKHLGIFRRRVGYFSETATLSPGKHTFRVRVQAEAQGYDQTKQLEGEFEKNEEKTLAIGCDWRRGSLSMSLR